MPKRLRRSLFVMILIGLLTSASGCYRSSGDDGEDKDDGDTASFVEGDGDADGDSDGDGDGDGDSDGATDSDSDGDSDTTPGPDTESVLDTYTDTGADTDGDGDTDADGDVDTDADGDGDPNGDTDAFCPWGWVDAHEVSSPDPGYPANPDELCGSEDTPPEVNADATFVLEADSDDPYQAEGKIEFPPELRDRLTEPASVEIFEAYPSAILEEATVSDVSIQGGVVTFRIAFPSGSLYVGYSVIRLRLSATLTCDSGTGEAQPFTSQTRFELCGEDFGATEWVASGETCEVCYTMCEVVATPIPAPDWDSSPLSGMPEADVRTEPLPDGTVRLIAEPRRTTGEVRYEWRVSDGELIETKGNTALWRPPAASGPHLVQVALRDDHSAGVSTLTWKRPT